MVFLLRLIIFSVALAFAAMLIWAWRTDPVSLGDAFMAMFEAPWTSTAIADLYVGFALAALIILRFERNVLIGLLWALPIFLLGNVVTCLWFVWRLPEIWVRLRD